MARVWAAEQIGDLGFRRLVALKTILPDFALDATFRAMFLDEAQLASQIHHANVVEVLDLGVCGPIVFQAMTFIDGGTLSAWLGQAEGRQPSLGPGVRIMIDVLRGLHAAHQLCDDSGTPLGLVHRDVSPQNVLIGIDGVAKLADFGIAKAFRRSADETKAGAVKGKIAYMAPELLDGAAATPQSDLFSAGVVLWEVMTGQRLFPRLSTTTGGNSQRRRIPIRDPREVVPGLPGELAAIVMRALEKDPKARYETSLEMADALEEAARKLGLEATSRHVAARLEDDLGDTMRGLRDAIRMARRMGGARSSESSIRSLVTPTGPHLPPPSSSMPVAATVALPRSGMTMRRQRRGRTLAGLLLAVAAFGILGAVMFRSPNKATGSTRPEVVVASPAPPPSSVAPAAVASELPPRSISDLPSVASAAPPPAARRANPGRLRVSPTASASAPPATTASAPKPRFESPY